MTKAILPRTTTLDNDFLGDPSDALKHLFRQALRGAMDMEFGAAGRGTALRARRGAPGPAQRHAFPALRHADGHDRFGGAAAFATAAISRRSWSQTRVAERAIIALGSRSHYQREFPRARSTSSRRSFGITLDLEVGGERIFQGVGRGSVRVP